MSKSRNMIKLEAINRQPRKVFSEEKFNGKIPAITDYYAENTFDFRKSDMISDEVKEELIEATKATSKTRIPKEHADQVAKAVVAWASKRGATHFCHWFQPLTGTTAEKHDSFLSFSKDEPILKLSGSQLMQGEPDASSFPNGGSRSTFEARGYTSWDLTSPLFLREGENGRTLCIPTAFVSYNGDALDVKTPLLRSITALNNAATKFLQTIGDKDVTNVVSTCGCEQEYFLIDKAFYYARPDMVMSNRTLLGSLTTKNQQLSDHYFGTIPERVLAFMQELDYKLHRLGIPSKTRHNEVAPGQFEIAPIFEEANVAVDHNQLLMAVIKKVAQKHDFVAILHEKPFAGINGSGKHLNWSMATNTGDNLLEPGTEPHKNHRFLAMVSIVVDAVFKHSKALRMAIAGHGNDHRLGANEAPPSIISVFLGDTLTKIYEAFESGSEFNPIDQQWLDMGAGQLADLLRDNTDRNRTSPFAFTGNKFEFRAVGSSQNAGFPLSILNAAMTDALLSATTEVEKSLKAGKSVDESLLELIRTNYKRSKNVVFGGDGYSSDWVEEAAKRGLPNLRNTAEALTVLKDEKATAFLTETNTYRPIELLTRYNVAVESYNMSREIEFTTLSRMVRQYVLPAAVHYKKGLLDVISTQKEIEMESVVEKDILGKVDALLNNVYKALNAMESSYSDSASKDEEEKSLLFASKVLPLSEELANRSNELEEFIPDELWDLPYFLEMLFIR
ncbi:MAG: glutamine synthetase III [Bacteriovoracaceae bacterium]